MRALEGRGFLEDTTQPNATWLEGYIPPEEQPRVLEAIREAIRTKGVFELEHRVFRPDKTLGWTLSRAVPLLDGSGEILEWFGAASNVTERHEAEEELARARRLRAIGQLAGGISHDFNNVLTVITGNLELAEMRTKDADLQRWIGNALAAASTGGTFARHLLSLAGGRRLEPRVFRFNERIRALNAVIDSVIGEHIVVREVLAPDLGASFADLAELDSAVLNLVLNARDAMPNGGTLTFATHNLTIRKGEQAARTPPGEYVCLTI